MGSGSSKAAPPSKGSSQGAPRNLRMPSYEDDREMSLGNYVIDTDASVKPGDFAPAAATYEKPDAVREFIRASLKKNFIFQALSPAGLDHIIDVFRPVPCKVGEDIIQQGAHGDYMYAIEAGRFDVVKEGTGKIAEMGPGQTFGELALLYGAKRSATVRCTEAATLWAMDRATFRYYRATIDQSVSNLAVEVLRQVPLLKDLNPFQLAKVAEVGTTQEFNEGDTIIRKGEIGHTFYIVMEGVVVCTDASILTEDTLEAGSGGETETAEAPTVSAAETMKTKGAAPAVVSVEVSGAGSVKGPQVPPLSSSSKMPLEGKRLQAGGFFGEIALLTGSPRTANVLADSSVRLLCFDRDSFEQALGSLKDLLDKKASLRMLCDVPLLAKLRPREREHAFEMFDTESFEPGDVLVRQGDRGSKFFLVRSGTGVVTKRQVQEPGGAPPALSGAGPMDVATPASDTSKGASNKPVVEEPSVPPPPLATAPPPGAQGGESQAVRTKKERVLTPGGGAVRGAQRQVQESFDGSMGSMDSFNSFDLGKSMDVARTSSPQGPGKGSSFAPIHENDLAEAVTMGAAETLREVKMGDHFGVQALVTNTAHATSVVATTAMTCFVLGEEDFYAILHEYEQATGAPTPRTSDATPGTVSVFSDHALLGADSTATEMPSFEGSAAGVASNQLKRASPGTQGDTASSSGVSQSTSSGESADAAHAARLDVDWGALLNLGKIGAGTFGTVLMMQDTRDNEVYAMKVLDRKRVKKMRQERRLQTEKEILRSLNSPFITRLFGDTEDESAFYLLLEMVQGGELQRLIHPSDPEKRAQQQANVERGVLAGIPHQPAKFYAAVIALPLQYIHRHMIAFRDLKPENVMIDAQGYPKLIDFGLAKPLEATGGKTYTLCGTPEYLAPEVILGTGHHQAVDWWALGVLLYEMVVGSSPFVEPGVERRKQDHMVIFENIVDNRVEYPSGIEPWCKDLIKRLLAGKPTSRMCSGRRGHKEFEEHPWFSDVVDWVLLARRQLQPPWYPPLANTTDQACFKKAK